MYYYLIDPKSYDGKNFEYEQSRLLSLLNEYQVAGEAARVTPIRGVKDLVATAVSHGVKTLVVVGGDETFSRALSVFHGKPITVGFIPLNSKSEIAKVLGMPQTLDACVAAIAKRLVNSFDIVRVSDAFFISSVRFESPEKECQLFIDESFRIRAKVLGGKIINAQEAASKRLKIFSDPGDGQLEVVLVEKLSWFSAWRYRRKFASKQFEALPGRSVLHAKSLRILAPDGMPLYMGEYLIARTPTSILITDEKLRIVVGKNRIF